MINRGVRHLRSKLNAVLALLLASASTALGAILNGPPQAAVDAAIAAPMIRFNRTIAGGAYTNGAFNGGASITLALASHVGNTKADARLLQQIRYTLTAGNEICANGGYPAQHELHVTGMFTIAKMTPRIWNQLSAAEKTKVDLLMKASLVASAFTTANNNPYFTTGTQQVTLNGDPNVNREWGPNYREGMLGAILVGIVYFGGATGANAVLDTYNHSQFIAALNANSLPNTYEIFNWKAANPTSAAPSGTMIQNAVRSYQYKTFTLANPLGIYGSLAETTYNRNVNAGLNGGAGINGAGKLASGAANLPNPGALGMLTEFDGRDAKGPRSSLVYSYDGYRPHQTNQILLILGGYWQKDSAIAIDAVKRLKIGNSDLWYKITQGYIGYAHGASQGALGTTFYSQRGTAYVWPLWENVLKPFHDSTESAIVPDSDGDGFDDATEALLGLDPNNNSSVFTASLSSGSLEWNGASGLTFTVQRTGGSPMAWQTIATIVGTGGTVTYRDPSPPAGRALYRVGVSR